MPGPLSKTVIRWKAWPSRWKCSPRRMTFPPFGAVPQASAALRVRLRSAWRIKPSSPATSPKAPLERGEFGEVSEQANGAADVVRAFANGRDCYAKLANVAGCVAVFDLLATKDFASGQTFTDEAGKVGAFAEGFTGTAKIESAMAE